MTPAETLFKVLARRPALAEPEAAATLRAAAAAIADWPAVIEQARVNNLLGLLVTTFDTCGPASPPEAARGPLAAARTGLAKRGLAFGGALLRVLAALDRNDIRALPYKGLVLSQQAYGDPGLRWSVDIDVLVASDDVAGAAEALAGIGYTPCEDLAGRGRRLIVATECETTFMSPSSPPLEIHWQVLPGVVNRRLDLAALVPRSQTVALLGRSLRIAGDADTLILQAAHGWKHGWLDIEAAVAMGHLLSRCAADVTDDAVRRARALGFERRLLLAVALAERLTGVRAAGTISRLIESDSATRRRADSLAAVQESPAALADAQRVLHHGRSGWQSFDLDGRAAAALCRLQRATWPSAVDREALHLPTRLWRAYWVLRPARIAVDALRRPDGSQERADEPAMRQRPD